MLYEFSDDDVVAKDGVLQLDDNTPGLGIKISDTHLKHFEIEV